MVFQNYLLQGAVWTASDEGECIVIWCKLLILVIPNQKNFLCDEVTVNLRLSYVDTVTLILVLHLFVYLFVHLFVNFVKNFSFSWYGLKNRFLLIDSLSPLDLSIFGYLSTAVLRFIFIDFSKVSTTRSGVSCFRWGWVYCYLMPFVKFGNIKSNVFSLL